MQGQLEQQKKEQDCEAFQRLADGKLGDLERACGLRLGREAEAEEEKRQLRRQIAKLEAKVQDALNQQGLVQKAFVEEASKLAH